ncbi:hypothetical protein V2J09_016548 [Rumex salicifolius]
MRYLLKKFDFDMLTLFETHAAGTKAAMICQRLGLENSFCVDAQGQSGGIWLLWRKEIGLVSIYVHPKVEIEGEVIHVIVVYDAPSPQRWRTLWEELKGAVSPLTNMMFIGGDFNTILRGDRYTWKQGRSSATFIAKRLDRIFCCAHARLQWKEVVVHYLPFFSSDHAPLHLRLCLKKRGNPLRTPFRFEATWMSQPSFRDLLITSWDPAVSTPMALEWLWGKLRRWNKEVFGCIQERKEKLMAEIRDIQSLISISASDMLIEKEEEFSKELEVVLEQEEMLWYQKSGDKWVTAGDRNTQFFHTSTITRRCHNKIDMLKNDEGRWVSESAELERMILDYYRELYSAEEADVPPLTLPRVGFVPLSRTE